MKKSTIWTIVAIVIIAIGGGVFYATQKSNNNQVDASYNSAMQSGKDAVAEKDYSKASSDFDKALGIKKTAQAEAYKAQANNMLSAISSTKAGKYEQALNKVDKVVNQANGYSVLTSQGHKLKSTVKDVQDNYEHEIKPLLDAASADAENKQYQKAVDQYQKVLDLPYIDGKYYAKYRKEAEAGLSDNKEAAKAEKAENSNHTGAKSDGQDTGNAGNTGEGSMGDHKVHGKTVTDGEIAELRQRVTKLGFNGMSWSPQDLIDLYRKSGRANPSQITKDDIQSYLKP